MNSLVDIIIHTLLYTKVGMIIIADCFCITLIIIGFILSKFDSDLGFMFKGLGLIGLVLFIVLSYT